MKTTNMSAPLRIVIAIACLVISCLGIKYLVSDHNTYRGANGNLVSKEQFEAEYEYEKKAIDQAAKTLPDNTTASKETPDDDYDRDYPAKGTVDDPDGYVNIREAANKYSTVIEKVQTGATIYFKPIDNKWWPVKTASGSTGYIFYDRIATDDAIVNKIITHMKSSDALTKNTRKSDKEDNNAMARNFAKAFIGAALMQQSESKKCIWCNKEIPQSGGWDHGSNGCNQVYYSVSKYCSKRCCMSDGNSN